MKNLARRNSAAQPCTRRASRQVIRDAVRCLVMACTPKTLRHMLLAEVHRLTVTVSVDSNNALMPTIETLKPPKKPV